MHGFSPYLVGSLEEEVMSDNVINWPGETILPVPVERVLSSAIDKDLSEVMVIGWTKEGKLYLAVSGSGLGDCLILLERAKSALLDQP
jgi:hypothetical protein